MRGANCSFVLEKAKLLLNSGRLCPLRRSGHGFQVFQGVFLFGLALLSGDLVKKTPKTDFFPRLFRKPASSWFLARENEIVRQGASCASCMGCCRSEQSAASRAVGSEGQLRGALQPRGSPAPQPDPAASSHREAKLPASSCIAPSALPRQPRIVLAASCK